MDTRIGAARGGAAPSQSSPHESWAQERAPARSSDLQLQGIAVTWSIQLDRAAYPAELIKAYPRIANKLALCWSDPVLAARVLDSLLQDRRGGRKGFPDPIKEELVRLRRLFPATKIDSGPVGAWSLLATSDR